MLKRIEKDEFVELCRDHHSEADRPTLRVIFDQFDARVGYDERVVDDMDEIVEQINDEFYTQSQDDLCKFFYEEGDELEDVIEKVNKSDKFVAWVEYKELALMRY